MKRSNSQGGFTLIELVIIILVLGILAATAIPKFYDMSAKAKDAAEKGVVGGVRGGIAIMYASSVLNSSSGTFPTDLDGAAPGPATTAIKLFSNVLSPGIDADWSKSASNVYWGPAGHSFKYTSAAGTFE